jgi:predicted nucleic acid-binding protein
VVNLRASFTLIADLPSLTGIVRDPNGDMVVACAVAGSASHIVTRDLDLLCMEKYEGIAMVTPEAFLTYLRGGDNR